MGICENAFQCFAPYFWGCLTKFLKQQSEIVQYFRIAKLHADDLPPVLKLPPLLWRIGCCSEILHEATQQTGLACTKFKQVPKVLIRIARV